MTSRSLFLICWLSLVLPVNALAESFVVERIDVRGVKKITSGTVFNYLPVNIGETFDTSNSASAIRELYSTGFFSDVQLLREGNVLVIEVTERPAIAEVNFEGNNDIPDETLEAALDQVGMSKGRIFDQHKLDRLELELQQVYYSMGKYAAEIKGDWRELDEGRVAIDITVSEGESATIKAINITGNQRYTEEELLKNFELEASTSGLFANDAYASTTLSADLEALKSYYLDRGYLNFDVLSQQVTISPDREDISITVNIYEGKEYRINEINIQGEQVVPEEDLLALVGFNTGEVFSRKAVNQTVEAMKQRLGDAGYAFARVNALPDIREDEDQVDLRFVIVPGNKVYIRNIIFSGNVNTQDLVLRREMRLFEGELYNRSKVDRSRVRLQRLNYISGVQVETARIADSEDRIDLVMKVNERFSGNITAGFGFSEAQGFILNFGFGHENIFGSGKSLDVEFNNSAASERYRLRYRDPYYTPDGVSRGVNFTFTQTDAEENNTSNYLIDTAVLSIDYGIPVSEYNRVRLEIGLSSNEINLGSNASDEVLNFVRDNNDKYGPATTADEIDKERYVGAFGAVSFANDTRNRRIFATSGQINSVGLELFGGDLDYYKLRYRHSSALALTDTYTFQFSGRLGYGASLNETTDFPFFQKFTAGGVRSVRGYDFNSLGPIDSNGDRTGGNLQVLTTTEIVFPLESLGSADTFRLGLYFDAGTVFADYEDFDADELRQSVGLSAKWFTPIGPLEFSYALPLNDRSGDDTKNFQFSLGAVF